MLDQSAAIAAAVRAMHGESDLVALMPALADDGLARVIACAPGVHPFVGAVAALCGGLPSLLDQTTAADPAFHDALARLIGTPAGRAALRAWAEVAPAGWGHAHMETLIAAVHANMVDASVAAALIGACDASAGLLHASRDVAFAIRCWGRSAPAAPTAWADALSAAERKRLTDTALRAPSSAACCLPWLPPGMVTQTRLDDASIGAALDAFAAASSAARTQHAAVIQRLAARTPPADLDTLTRLACAMGSKKVWRRVQMLMIKGSLDDSWRVVAAASWDDLPKDVRIAILKRADRSDVCAAIAAARGKKGVRRITCESAAAFFATLDTAVWDAMDAAAQQRWLHALWRTDVHLAVRSLGLRPAILARALIADDLVRAAQRHARDERTLRWALLPVALRDRSPGDAHALIAALPTMPPDPGAFFCIAGMHGDAAIIAPARSALRTPADLALAVAIGMRGAHDRSRRDVLQALLTAPAAHHAAGWQALDDAMRQAIGTAFTTAPPHGASLAERDPIAALALAALHADDADIRTAGIAALIARPDLVRAFWDRLSPDVQHILARRPTFADLMQTPTRSAIRRDLRRRRA